MKIPKYRKFPFGKYENELTEDVLKKDYQYCIWVLDMSMNKHIYNSNKRFYDYLKSVMNVPTRLDGEVSAKQIIMNASNA